MLNKIASYSLGFIVIICILLNGISPAMALLIGMLSGIFGLFNNDVTQQSIRPQKYLLQLSVIGLGFGIQLQEAFIIGTHSFFISFATILCTFIVALTVGKLMGSEKKLTTLIASGTAICGGSAIAAVSPSIKANPHQTSMALAVIFILNAIALFIFPPIGHFFELSETQFGLWSAIAIHDTSSVIGASQSFGATALNIATTTKLVRTLWIIPLVLAIALYAKSGQKLRFPWFILGFIAAMVLASYVPAVARIDDTIVWLSRKLLIFTLFLIGLQINIARLRKLGVKTLIVGVSTWLVLLIFSFLYVFYYV